MRVRKAGELLDDIDRLLKHATADEREKIVAMVYGWAIRKQSGSSSTGNSNDGGDWHSGQQQWER